MALFEGKKSSIDINDTMSDDDVVTFDVPPRFLFFSSKVLNPYYFFSAKSFFGASARITRTLASFPFSPSLFLGNAIISIQRQLAEMSFPCKFFLFPTPSVFPFP